jgi:hypothetical protein
MKIEILSVAIQDIDAGQQFSVECRDDSSLACTGLPAKSCADYQSVEK